MAVINFFKGPAIVQKRNNLVRFSFWFFIFCNIVAEYVSFYVLYGLHRNNEFVYGISIMLHPPALFIFYGLVTQKRVLYIACFIGYALIAVVYFMEEYWDTSSIYYVFHVAGYYTIMTITSLIFLWYNLKDPQARKHKFVVRLGIMFSIYFTLAFTIIPINFVFERYAGEMFFYYAGFVMNIIYYCVFAIILFVNQKQTSKHAPGIS
jgi:hypothetical protein